MERVETNLQLTVAPEEYRRLLGFPPGHTPDERSAELMRQSTEWYARHGKPWIYLRVPDEFDVSNGVLRIEAQEFFSPTLVTQLRQAEAHAAAIVLVSAGAECERRAAELWQEEKPDEYFFLEILGSAVVEHLVQQAGAQLCAWAATQAAAVLPHYSPGYTGWEVADQVRLFELAKPGSARWPEPVVVRESGMLEPKKSLLALFGLTRNLEKARGFSDLIPCQTCSFAPCQFRRAPFREPRVIFDDVQRLQPSRQAAVNKPEARLSTGATYVTSTRALRKWAAERLKLDGSPQAGFTATFSYEGTTCSSLGWPLLFDYHVRLGPAPGGYCIEQAWCGPSPEDTGHTRMCAWLREGAALMQAIETEKPLLGQPLEAVLTWSRPISPAGCYCERPSRDHKWALVFEVLHYALVQRQEVA